MSRGGKLEMSKAAKAATEPDTDVCILEHKDWMVACLMPADALGGEKPRSFPEALSAYVESAKAGDPASSAALGTMYLFGWGVMRSYKLARDFFLSARNRDHPRGNTGMGILALNGWGGEPLDHLLAARMLARGVELGDPLAMYEQAMMGYHKKGNRDIDWAAVFVGVENSAKLGYAPALHQLGLLYFKGTPLLPFDLRRALAVLEMAEYQGYEPSREVIAEVKKVIWSEDVEGQIREAVMEGERFQRETEIERVKTARLEAHAISEEDHVASLKTRIAGEKVVLKKMKALLLRTLERAELEVKRAEIAEAELAIVKAKLEAVKELVEEEKERIKKLKIRAEFLMTELRRKQRFHVASGGKWEGEWLPHLKVGDPVPVGAIPLHFTRRWTCCDCTNKGSFYCKPFCGCGEVTEHYCEAWPLPAQQPQLGYQ